MYTDGRIVVVGYGELVCCGGPDKQEVRNDENGELYPGIQTQLIELKEEGCYVIVIDGVAYNRTFPTWFVGEEVSCLSLWKPRAAADRATAHLTGRSIQVITIVQFLEHYQNGKVAIPTLSCSRMSRASTQQ